ncbi:GAF domain-containing protein [Leptolyngbya sp. FACHB-8]|uniref:GAF domain-containing protein n=1 Tax=unclassified Leptolyngbya TaxID=2650499 RepID=UPI001686C00B|nr:GAF domain-containing protein [Leptolyngbya sp. FACHB-8]MBD1909682.1 GAF domain-containing protein [Leptolyngbya sp. FACHB-8]
MTTGVPTLQQAIDRHPLLVAPNTPLLDVLAWLKEHPGSPECALVVDNEQLVGVFTAQELISLTVAHQDLAAIAIGDVMAPPLLTLQDSDLLEATELLALMQQHQIQQIPVLNHLRQVIGIVTPLSLLHALSSPPCPSPDSLDVALNEASGWLEVQQAEAALQQSQQRYQTLVGFLNGIVWEADPKSLQFTFVSPQVEAILGYPAEAWLQPNFWEEHLHPDDRLPTLKACHQARALRQMHNVHYMEYRMVAADGHVVWLYDTVRLVQAPDQSVRLVGFMLETTYQKQVQSQLQEQEQVYRVLVENSPDIIERFDTQLRHLYISPALTAITGLPADVFLGKTCRDLNMAEEMVCAWEAAAARLLATGEKQIIEFETATLMGVRSFEMAIAPELTHDQVIQSILCISRDVTDRKRTEAALRQQQHYTEQIAESTLAILYIYDLEENRNVYVNHQIEAVLGYSPAEIQSLGSGLFPTLLHPEDRPRMAGNFQRCSTLQDGDVLEIEYRMRHKAGEYRWLLGRDRVLNRTEDGSPRQMLGVATDITILKETQAALQQQAERERLVAAIAQRVRQSLNLETILSTTVAEVRQFLQSDRVIIYRFEQDWSGIVVAESVTKPWQSILNMEIRDSYFVETRGQTYQQGTIRAIADVFNAGFSPCHMELMEQLQVRAKLIVPILQGDHLWGLLVANHCSKPRTWQPWEGELLSQLATQVGIAIQQANLYEQAQLELAERQRAETALQHLNRELEQRVQERTEALLQQAEQERLLRFVTQHIHQSFNFDTILTTVLLETRQTLKADRVALYRFNPDWSGSFVAESVEEGWVPLVGPNIQKVWEDTHLQVSQGGRYQKHETFALSDIYQANLSHCHLELLEQFQAKAFAIAPIFVHDTLWGLLAAYQNTGPRTWQSWEIDLLQQISLQTAIAIQQSELYSQLKNELRQKEVLIKEVHHRVKNNLQVVSSLLNLQSASIENPDILQPFIESQRRISVMAMIHERLYRSGNLARLNFADYIRDLVDDVFQSYLPVGLMVNWSVEVANLDLELDLAIPCGLIVNELVSNAIKYAFSDDLGGEILILFENNLSQYNLIIQDNGIGFPEHLDFRQTESLGMQIVCALTRQLGGTIELSRSSGTTFTIIFDAAS